MKSLTSGIRSARIEVILCTLSLATIVCCQGNSPAPSTETTSTAATTQAPTTETPTSEVPAATTSVSLPPTSSIASSETVALVTKPNLATTTAKTPHPKSSNATLANDLNAPSTNVSPASPATADTPDIDKPCSAGSFDFPAVESACEKGGIPKAKALMKSWVNKAKEKGESYKCTSCHDNQRTYSNKPNAVADLRKLLNVIK